MIKRMKLKSTVGSTSIELEWEFITPMSYDDAAKSVAVFEAQMHGREK